MIRLFKCTSQFVAESAGTFFILPHKDWDSLINTSGLYTHLQSMMVHDNKLSDEQWKTQQATIQAPIGTQEVWASGVTYLRSRNARMEESEHAKSAYDLVYDADRPELFFKSLAHRVAGPGQEVYIRKDSTWNVPEPELTLCINKEGFIAGYTIGNDMSSRSIEGENTLYLPQAKTYERSAALGPCLLILPQPINPETEIDLKIFRANKCVFHGQTKLNTMKRKLSDLRDYLLRGLRFEQGCFLMTGTGIVPDSSFTLEAGDVCDISVEGIGTLSNVVKWF